jgi:GAF domain/PilZ domain/Sel1 repeat
MSAIAQVSQPISPNRRRRVRQKVHAPAYAILNREASGEMLDLYEVLDISEVGVSIQFGSPMNVGQEVDLCLDLAEATGQISATARVVWSNATGRAGLALPSLNNSALHRLREWLFLNAMAAAANAADSSSPRSAEHSTLRPNYTDILSAASAVQREAESLGSDLESVLSLIVSRSQSLLRAAGAAIALAEKDSAQLVETISPTILCRASAGQSAPPIGAALQVDSGFSGECVRTGTILRCDDCEADDRVDRQSCRALGIRSILAAPIRSTEKVIGLLEIFSAQPSAFGENDTIVLQRFAETIATAVARAARAEDSSVPPQVSPQPFTPAPGSVLFAHDPDENVTRKNLSANEDKIAGIHLPRAHLYLLFGAAATIALALGLILAPWIQEKINARDHTAEHTVLASSQPPQPAAAIPQPPSIESVTLDQLRQFAVDGDPAAENALGLRFASGDGVPQNDIEAARWFTKAAESGNVKAQVALGTRYWAGRGVPASLTQAYFWTVLARAAGDKNSKTFAEFLASHMTRQQAAAVEQQANIWYQQHELKAKPSPAR